mgnify:CR=1 FL=1
MAKTPPRNRRTLFFLEVCERLRTLESSLLYFSWSVRRLGGEMKGFPLHKYTRTPDRENLHKNKKNTRIQTLKIHQKFNFASILKIQKKVARRQLGLMAHRTANGLDDPKLNAAVFKEKGQKNSPKIPF